MTIPPYLPLLLTLSVLFLTGCTETRTRQTCLYLAGFSKEEQAGTAEELKTHPDLKYLTLASPGNGQRPPPEQGLLERSEGGNDTMTSNGFLSHAARPKNI
ncbi:hypothetical protein PT277_05000 [Acetobacteraceae bacterium ESL0709]|nr:hypothetical protein [Acetobacteraceae bacterium ESL0697]MDF7678052.1 hypothetical protein [Acetobacteraceae bacterium ESL0709]